MEHKTIQPVTLPVSITVNPWLFDHRFEGAAVLPAVEMLQHMARAVQSHFPGAGVTSMQQASFDRFLRIEPACTVIDACCNLVMEESGSIRATLTTAGKVGKARQLQELKSMQPSAFLQLPCPSARPPAGALGAYHIPGFEIPACRLYGELVPFGPAFQSVQDRVTLTESAAVARVYALDHPGALGPFGLSVSV